MPYQVRTEQVGPRTLAAVRAATTPQRLSTDIIRLLDKVWPVLRGQGARTGHNVVVYHEDGPGELVIEAGVEVFSGPAEHGFTEDGEVVSVATPAGEAAVTTHYGEYSDLGGAYAAVSQWCSANGRSLAGVNWEVYGDWDDDPAKRRTDLYALLYPVP